MNKKLTIVIPTYNRIQYLSQTLALFEQQIIRNEKEVSLIVSNNASTDGTKETLDELHSKSPFFDVVNFTEHVDIGLSITRSNDLAESEFILMWGDDDYPFPFTVDYLLKCINDHPNISLIHFNRLHGIDDVNGMNNLVVQCNMINGIGEHVLSVKECIKKYVLDMSFLTSIVFKRVYWKKNASLDCSKHFGYEFMGHILHGMEKENAVYVEFPMCIQRMPSMRSWMQRSPLYRFVGIPNMYADFQQWGLVDNSKELWMKQGNNVHQFLAVMFQTSMYKSFYRPLFKEICSHQFGCTRKSLTFFFIFLCPAWIYKFARRLKYKSL